MTCILCIPGTDCTKMMICVPQYLVMISLEQNFLELLQASGDSDLHLQQQKIEVKSREEMMGKVPPQVAVIPPIIDLTRTPEYSQVEKLKGQGVSGGDLGKGGKSPSVLMGVAVGSSEGQQRGHGGEVKSVEKTSGVVMAGQGEYMCVCLHMNE